MILSFVVRKIRITESVLSHISQNFILCTLQLTLKICCWECQVVEIQTSGRYTICSERLFAASLFALHT